jgi:hypothetical protein
MIRRWMDALDLRFWDSGIGAFVVLCFFGAACAESESDGGGDDARFEVLESPGTGTTGGNPTPTVVVGIDRPLNEGVIVQWERPQLNFDTVEVFRINPMTNGCDLSKVVTGADVRATLGADARLLFVGSQVCGVSLRRDLGPVLVFQGARPNGRRVEVSFADGAELQVDLTQWERVRRSGGRLSLDFGALIRGLAAGLEGASVDDDVRLTDFDESFGELLRSNLRSSLVGYVDSDSNGELSAEERDERGVFLRFDVDR